MQQNATGMNIAKTVNKIIEENGNIVSIQLVPTTPASYSDITFTESDYFDDNVGNTYLPSNHKMYHSPFKKIVITNSQGEQKEYKWEMFRDTTTQNVKQATFGINMAKLPVPELHIYPKQYAQMEQENGLIFNGFPTYAWSEDTFSKWWAQNSTATIMGMVSGTIASYIGLNLTTPPKKKVGDYVGKRTALGVVEDAIGFAQQLSVMSNTPDTQNGSFTGNVTTISEDRMGFTIYEMSIRPEIAKTIDNFFTKFGYACKKLKN
jgi:hypothetical protein